MTLAPFFSSESQNTDDGTLPKIAIVGRGFTGMMTAIALLKGLRKPFHLVMFDPQPKIDGGEGLRPSTATLLNSRVRDLSVDPEMRDDFRQWLDTHDAGRNRASADGGSSDYALVSGQQLLPFVESHSKLLY